MDQMKDTVAAHLGGSTKKPAKEIAHITHQKSTNGDHIFTHRHKHPEHHPDEVHTKRGDDEMVEHMMAHAGTPNPGEDTSDPGSPAAMAAASSPASAPSPSGSGAISPSAAAPMGAM